MVNKITFQNFKLFIDEQNFELKPMTILIGKNSSGKSALAKLPTLISESLKGSFDEPFSWENDGVILGSNYADLNHGKETTGLFNFSLEDDKGNKFRIEIQFGKNKLYISTWNYNDEFILTYDLSSKKYLLNLSQKKHEVKFNGFLIEKIFDYDGDSPSLDSFKFDFDYVCSYRIQPNQINEDLPKEKNIKKIGIDGGFAYEILINDFLVSDSELLQKVSSWYQKTFDGWGINIDNDISRNKFYFELKRVIPTIFKTSLDNVGQGISQTLPLITKSYIKEEKPSLTIIEEPELHLHPSAHGDLAERFAESLEDVNKRYLIETHSENFILRLRRLIAEKKFEFFTTDHIRIYYVEYDESTNKSNLREVFISESGDVKNWPRKVFSESLDELIAIKNAQNN